MTIARTLCGLAMAITVAGCDTDAGRKQARPSLGEAAVGNVLGSKIGDGDDQLPTTALGTLLGAYHGSEVGRLLDRADRRYAEDAAEKSLGISPSGYTSHWSNPDTGHTGTFTPTNTYWSNDDLRCRDYDQSITIDERTQNAYGTACRTDDGLWWIVETPVRRALRRRR